MMLGVSIYGCAVFDGAFVGLMSRNTAGKSNSLGRPIYQTQPTDKSQAEGCGRASKQGSGPGYALDVFVRVAVRVVC